MNEIPYYHARHGTSVAVLPSVWRTHHILRGRYLQSQNVGFDEVWHIKSIVARNLPSPVRLSVPTLGYATSTSYPPPPEAYFLVRIRASTWRDFTDVYLFGSEEWKFDPPLVVNSSESLEIEGMGIGFEEDGREINLYVHFIRCTGPDAKKSFPQMGSIANAINEEELKRVVDKTFRSYMEEMWEPPKEDKDK